MDKATVWELHLYMGSGSYYKVLFVLNLMEIQYHVFQFQFHCLPVLADKATVESLTYLWPVARAQVWRHVQYHVSQFQYHVSLKIEIWTWQPCLTLSPLYSRVHSSLSIAVCTLVGDPYPDENLLNPLLRHQLVCSNKEDLSLFIECFIGEQKRTCVFTFHSMLSKLTLPR